MQSAKIQKKRNSPVDTPMCEVRLGPTILTRPFSTRPDILLGLLCCGVVRKEHARFEILSSITPWLAHVKITQLVFFFAFLAPFVNSIKDF
jgi:hypothetical protein